MLYTYNDTLSHKLKSALSLTWMLIQVPTGGGTIVIGKNREDVETQQTGTPAGSTTSFGFQITSGTNLTFPVPWAGDFWVRATTAPMLIVIIETTDPSDQTQPRGVPQFVPNASQIRTSISGIR